MESTKKQQEAVVINHPSYYGGDSEYEVIKCIEAWVKMGLRAVSHPYIFTAVVYAVRAGSKGDELADLKKARWYLDRRIAQLEGKTCAHGKLTIEWCSECQK